MGGGAIEHVRVNRLINRDVRPGSHVLAAEFYSGFPGSQGEQSGEMVQEDVRLAAPRRQER